MSVLRYFPKDSSSFNGLLDVFQMGLENRLKVLEHQQIGYAHLEDDTNFDLSGLKCQFKNNNFKATLESLIENLKDDSKRVQLKNRITNVVISNTILHDSLYVLFTVQTDVKSISLNITLSLEYFKDSVLPSTSFEIATLEKLQNKTHFPRPRKYLKSSGNNEPLVLPYFPVSIESNTWQRIMT